MLSTTLQSSNPPDAESLVGHRLDRSVAKALQSFKSSLKRRPLWVSASVANELLYQLYKASTLPTQSPLWVIASIAALQKFYKASAISCVSSPMGQRLVKDEPSPSAPQASASPMHRPVSWRFGKNS